MSSSADNPAWLLVRYMAGFYRHVVDTTPDLPASVREFVEAPCGAEITEGEYAPGQHCGVPRLLHSIMGHDFKEGGLPK
jgi:hypothetical protein